jgi:hypothetical protein
MKTEYLLLSLQGHAISPRPDPRKFTSSLINISFSLSQSNYTYFNVFRVISLFFRLNLLALKFIQHALPILSTIVSLPLSYFMKITRY